ncbi:hypothetical protein DRO61_08575 [Candidatus Bathyarchaeota archaeon]|jgi:hypothetical protein|nr:MAG: hypothetical protein DRO61_08575 [Candidatus Bathyarchaeota archaeon]
MQEAGIKIEYTPITHIQIMDVTKLSLKELAKRVQAMTQFGRPTMLNWAEGIAFLSIPMHFESDDLVKKYLEGEIVLQNIIYAPMPDYKTTIKVQTYDVYVLNQTPSKILRAIAKWLSKRAKNDDI